jgi:drug/metabolite transporter (DMT)-like permease
MIPAWVALRSRRWPSGLVLLCCALVLGGVAVLGRFDFRALALGRGEIETLACSVFFMFQILLLERKDFSANRPLPVSLVMFAVQAVMFASVAVGSAPTLGSLVVPWTQPGWLGLTLMLTVFCTLGAYILMNTFQPRITATEAGLIYCGEPVFASVMALFLPAVISGWIGINYANETVTWHLLVGGGLITLANLLLQLNPPAKTS